MRKILAFVLLVSVLFPITASARDASQYSWPARCQVNTKEHAGGYWRNDTGQTATAEMWWYSYSNGSLYQRVQVHYRVPNGATIKFSVSQRTYTRGDGMWLSFFITQENPGWTLVDVWDYCN